MRVLILLLISTFAVWCQTQPVRVVADCAFSFNLTTNTSTGSFDNRNIGCNNWAITWETFGATPAVSLTFQGANSDATGTAPDTFGTFNGTIFQGTNPSTDVASAITAVGYSPWIRVNVSGLSGTVKGTVLGCRLPCTPPANSGTAPIGSVTVSNFPDPQNVKISTGTCTLKAVIDASVTGNLEIVPVSGSLTPYICHLSFSMDTAVNVKLTRGTGTDCGTGTADITGPYQNVLALSLDRDISPIAGAASGAICLNTSGASTVGGIVLYKYQ